MSCFIIADAGLNHDGDLERALQLVSFAKESGANAVKFQVFSVDTLLLSTVQNPSSKSVEPKDSQYEMLQKLALDRSAYQQLRKRADELGIEFLATPLDSDSVRLLVQDVKLSRIKVASGDLTNGPLLLQMARTGLPIILSTGMGTTIEIQQALKVLAFGYTNASGNPDRQSLATAYESYPGHKCLREKVTLLHSTTDYPAPFKHVNLRVMQALREAFHLPVGYSDHTDGILIAPVAVALGAVMLEKPLTLDCTLPGLDHAASLEPDDFKLMVQQVRIVEESLGTQEKMPTAAEIVNREAIRKKIVANHPIKYGEIFTADNLAVKRAAGGMSAMEFWNLCGHVATRDYAKDEVLEL